MAKKARIKKVIQKKIQDFIKLLEREGITVDKTILFGSFAQEKSHTDSDIDLAVISSQFGNNNFKELVLLRKLALHIDSKLEPIPLNPRDLNDRFSTLIHEIKTHGKIIKPAYRNS